MEKLKNWLVEKIWGTSYWIVRKAFYWLFDYSDRHGWCIVADEWFKTNYGSIPRLFRVIFDPTRYNSYVIHDAGYTNKVKYRLDTCEYSPLTRKEADKQLLAGLYYEWAWFIERVCIYFAVRIFGFIAWNVTKN